MLEIFPTPCYISCLNPGTASASHAAGVIFFYDGTTRRPFGVSIFLRSSARFFLSSANSGSSLRTRSTSPSRR
jgi:hypothetical protein